MSMSDGLVMRSLMNFPGGLELHIGVHTAPLHTVGVTTNLIKDHLYIPTSYRLKSQESQRHNRFGLCLYQY